MQRAAKAVHHRLQGVHHGHHPVAEEVEALHDRLEAADVVLEVAFQDVEFLVAGHTAALQKRRHNFDHLLAANCTAAVAIQEREDFLHVTLLHHLRGHGVLDGVGLDPPLKLLVSHLVVAVREGLLDHAVDQRLLAVCVPASRSRR